MLHLIGELGQRHRRAAVYLKVGCRANQKAARRAGRLLISFIVGALHTQSREQTAPEAKKAPTALLDAGALVGRYEKPFPDLYRIAQISFRELSGAVHKRRRSRTDSKIRLFLDFTFLDAQ